MALVHYFIEKDTGVLNTLVSYLENVIKGFSILGLDFHNKKYRIEYNNSHFFNLVTFPVEFDSPEYFKTFYKRQGDAQRLCDEMNIDSRKYKRNPNIIKYQFLKNKLGFKPEFISPFLRSKRTLNFCEEYFLPDKVYKKIDTFSYDAKDSIFFLNNSPTSRWKERFLNPYDGKMYCAVTCNLERYDDYYVLPISEDTYFSTYKDVLKFSHEIKATSKGNNYEQEFFKLLLNNHTFDNGDIYKVWNNFFIQLYKII